MPPWASRTLVAAGLRQRCDAVRVVAPAGDVERRRALEVVSERVTAAAIAFGCDIAKIVQTGRSAAPHRSKLH